MSTRRISAAAGPTDYATVPRGPNGNPLCRQCGVETTHKLKTFCNDICVSAWKIKTQPGHVRKLVLKRDRGVCSLCGIDTIALREAFDACKWMCRPTLPLHEADVQNLKKASSAFWKSRPVGDDYDPRAARAIALGFSESRASWWDADHIVPVIEGGGECDLSNYRTLCQPCHKKATKALAQRRAAARKTQ